MKFLKKIVVEIPNWLIKRLNSLFNKILNFEYNEPNLKKWG